MQFNIHTFREYKFLLPSGQLLLISLHLCVHFPQITILISHYQLTPGLVAQTPPSRSRVFSKTETFFCEYGYCPHITGVFGHRKRRFSNTLSRVEIFENGDSSYSCGRAKTEVLKYDEVMPRFKVCSSAHTIRKRYVCTQIFLNTEKKSQFSKIPGDVWTRPQLTEQGGDLIRKSWA